MSEIYLLESAEIVIETN